MKNSISQLIVIWVTIAFSVLALQNAFAQADHENSVEATSDNSDVKPTYVTGLTSARAQSLVGGVIGLISLVIGWRVKNRQSVRTGSGRSWAVMALALGAIAIILSLVHLASITGGFGTGGGKAGAIVSLALGLIGTVVNSLVLRRKR
jgi:hypothetical protein